MTCAFGDIHSKRPFRWTFTLPSASLHTKFPISKLLETTKSVAPRSSHFIFNRLTLINTFFKSSHDFFAIMDRPTSSLLQFFQGSESFSLTEQELVVTPKLEGKVNWNTWEASLYSTLNSLHAVFADILCGNLRAPTPPRLMKGDEIFRKARNELEVQKSVHERAPTADTLTWSDLSNKCSEIKTLEEGRKLCHEAEKFLYTVTTTNLRNFLTACCEEIPKALIQEITCPRLAFEALKKEYGPLSPAQLWKQFTEMRFDGDDAADFVKCFLAAKQELEEEIGTLSPALESYVFVAAVMDNPWCEVFVRHFRPGFDRSSLSDLYYGFKQQNGPGSINRKRKVPEA